jgi:predicted HicB family RNase H-like nuclease
MSNTEALERSQEVYRIAYSRFSRSPDWASFFREILGPRGIVRRTFSTPEARSAFEQSEEYTKIQQMLAKLRESGAPPNEDEEPTRVITVRLPKSLHEAIRFEAHEHQTSMNKLCISKLLRLLDNDMIPPEE